MDLAHACVHSLLISMAHAHACCYKCVLLDRELDRHFSRVIVAYAVVAYIVMACRYKFVLLDGGLDRHFKVEEHQAMLADIEDVKQVFGP